MQRAALIAEFADDGDPNNGRYANIYGTNVDALAWWDGADDYIVPMWYLGDIPAGESVTQRIRFNTYSNIPYGSELNKLLRDSYYNDTDIFLNRDSSVGLSNYPDVLAADKGAAFPVPPDLSSNVSVVFVPEPTTIGLFGLVIAPGIAFLRRRRA